MRLSEENKNNLNENFLYKKEPDKNKHYLSGAYWCKNWTFKVEFWESGKVVMRDTYWGSCGDCNYIEVTDENINDFEFVFDFREVVRVQDNVVNEYDPNDLYYVATDSGGYSCGKLYWRNKNTEKSKTLQIEKKKEEIRSLKHKLERAERELKEMLEA